MASIGKIIGVNGNLIRVKFESAVSQNEVAYAKLTQKNKDGKSEVIPLKTFYFLNIIFNSSIVTFPSIYIRVSSLSSTFRSELFL